MTWYYIYAHKYRSFPRKFKRLVVVLKLLQLVLLDKFIFKDREIVYISIILVFFLLQG